MLNYNLMIQDKRLGGNHIIKPEIALEMIQLITGSKALFPNFEDDRRHSRGEFSLFFRKNLTFNHSLNVKISLE